MITLVTLAQCGCVPVVRRPGRDLEVHRARELHMSATNLINLNIITLSSIYFYLSLSLSCSYISRSISLVTVRICVAQSSYNYNIAITCTLLVCIPPLIILRSECIESQLDHKQPYVLLCRIYI